MDPTVEILNLSNIDGQEVAFIADAHHVLKNIRNGFLKHEKVILPKEYVEQHDLKTNVVNLDVLSKLVAFDEGKELKVASHISRKDIDLEGKSFAKMHVSPAKRLLSQNTASSIEFLVKEGVFPEEYLTTSHFLKIIGKWAAIVCCKSRTLAFSHDDMEKYKETVEFLNFFIGFFATVKFGPRQRVLKPFQQGALLTTKSILWLADFLLTKTDARFFRAGTCLADCIEGFHGDARKINSNPTTVTYPRYVKALAITHALKRPTKGNCYEYDDRYFLANLKDIKRAQLETAKEQEDLEEELLDMEFIEAEYESGGNVKDNIVASTIGFTLLQTILTQSKCDVCKDAFVENENTHQAVNRLIRTREYVKGCLTKPTELGNQVFMNAEAMFNVNRDQFEGHEDIPRKFAKPIADRLASQFEIPTCHLELITRRFLKLRYVYWSRHRNESGEKENWNDIEGASFASRSTRSMTARALQ